MAITKIESSRDFFRIWFFWKKQAVLLFFIIVGAVMFYAYTATPKYESMAEILVLPKTNEGEVISSGANDQRIMPVTTSDIFTEIELLNSNSVLEDTVKSFGTVGVGLRKSEKSLLDHVVAPIKSVKNGILKILKLIPPPVSRLKSEVSFLKKSITVEPIIDSNIIAISLQAEKPERTTTVLSKLLSTYMKHRDNVFTQKEGQQFYDEQASHYRIKLDEAEKKLKAFQRESNIVNLQIQNQANIDLLTKLNNELKLIEIDYEEELHKIAMLKEIMIDEPSKLHLTKEMRDIPVIVELEKGIVPLLIRRSEISGTFTESSREYQSINGQVEMLRDEIRFEIKKAIQTDELEQASKKIKIETLINKIAYLQAEANELNQNEKKHKELERQVELYKESYLIYTNKTEHSKMFTQKIERELANVTVSSKPSVPENPISPNRLKLLILSIFIGVFAALFTPFILETIDNKIKTADDVEVLLGLPVICNYNEIK